MNMAGLRSSRSSKGEREVLFPIRLNSAIQNTSIDWDVAIRKQRQIKSLENWQEPSRYQKMLSDLLKDLQKEEACDHAD